jgi:putative tricarboxylic transport membrane protein
MTSFVDPLIGAAEILTDPSIWLLILIGTAFGVIVGALPGLATTLAYALILPFTFDMDPVPAVTMLLSVTVGVAYGNSIPAILVGVPGTPASVLTALDGYKMHQQGDTGYALAIAFVAAVLGQIVSVLFFIGAVIPLAGLAFFFLTPELFALFFFGVVAIVSLTGRNLLKGLMAAGIGLLIGMIGLDPVNFSPRFNFGVAELRAGVSTAAVIIGLLAVSELMRQSRQAFQWDVARQKINAKFPHWRRFLPVIKPMMIGTVVGTIIGAIPGAGGTPAALISYQQAQAWSKEPEKFGKGSAEAVAANEAAQNAASSGELIPTLGLGIPGSGSMVLLLATLSIHGFIGGPHLITDAPELLAAVCAGLLGATLLLIVTGWPIAMVMLRALSINRSIVIVFALASVVLGIFSLNYRIFDVLVCFAAGAIGFFFLRYGYSTAAAALAVVLSAGLEADLRRGLSLMENDPLRFVGRPITALILAGAVFFFIVGLRRARKADREARVLDREIERQIRDGEFIAE